MSGLRCFRSAASKTDLRETNRKTGEHGVRELGRKTALFYKLASGELGQERRGQRAVPSRVRLGWQGVEADVRSRFHGAQTRTCASYAFWLNKTWSESHRNREPL